MNEIPAQPLSTAASEPSPSLKKRFRFWRCFWLTFLVVSLAYAWYCFYVPGNGIAWADNFASAQRRAADAGKPMVLYFTGKWCVPCRVMKRQVWADGEVEAVVNSRFIPVAIDIDDPEEAAVLARYQVGAAPVTVIADPQGTPLRWRVGGMSKSAFLDLLNEPSPAAAHDSPKR